MSIFTPQMGAKGLFRLGAPLENLLVPDLQYTCTALRTIQDVASSGVDVFETYYTPIGLDAAAFTSDLASGAYLVTLTAGVLAPVVVPSTYFVEMPSIDGIKYIGTMVAIDLAILPADFDLNPLKQRLLEVVKDTIGVDGLLKVIVTTNVLTKTKDEHAVIEASRAMRINYVTTDYGLMLQERARADANQQKVQALTYFIQANLAPTP